MARAEQGFSGESRRRMPREQRQQLLQRTDEYLGIVSGLRDSEYGSQQRGEIADHMSIRIEHVGILERHARKAGRLIIAGGLAAVITPEPESNS